jgi:hypothetical protein
VAEFNPDSFVSEEFNPDEFLTTEFNPDSFLKDDSTKPNKSNWDNVNSPLDIGKNNLLETEAVANLIAGTPGEIILAGAKGVADLGNTIKGSNTPTLDTQKAVDDFEQTKFGKALLNPIITLFGNEEDVKGTVANQALQKVGEKIIQSVKYMSEKTGIGDGEGSLNNTEQGLLHLGELGLALIGTKVGGKVGKNIATEKLKNSEPPMSLIDESFVPPKEDPKVYSSQDELPFTNSINDARAPESSPLAEKQTLNQQDMFPLTNEVPKPAQGDMFEPQANEQLNLLNQNPTASTIEEPYKFPIKNQDFLDLQGGKINEPIKGQSVLSKETSVDSALDTPKQVVPKEAPLGTTPETQARLEKLIKIGSKANPSEIINSLDYGLGAVSTRIGNIHPRLKQKSVDFEYYNLKNTTNHLENVDPFLDHINKLPTEQLKTVDSLLLDNKLDVLKPRLQPQAKQALIKAEKVLSDIGDELVYYQLIDGKRKTFFPRIVENYDGMLEKMGREKATTLQDLLKEKTTKALSKGQEFTEFDKNQVIDSFLQNNYNKKGSPGFTKERVFDTIPPELMEFYASPTKTLHSYIRHATFQIEQAKFFGKSLVKDLETGKIDLPKSTDGLVLDLLNKGEITYKQVEEYHSLLNSRFKNANKMPNILTQSFKDAVNLGLLSDITNGLQQGADIGAHFGIDGMRPALLATAAKLSGKGKIKAKDFGLIDHIADEFVSDRLSTKVVNKVFRINQLANIDRVMKELGGDSAINSAKIGIKNNDKYSDIFNIYRDRFGDEFPQLVDDIKNGRKTDLTDRFVFSQLSMRQPISKLESSQWMMDSPNLGRFTGTLKSFTLKQADMVRNYAYNQIKNGKTSRDKAQGAISLAKIGLGLSL